MRTIKEWQRGAHALAVEKGFHSRECSQGAPSEDHNNTCTECWGTGRVPVDPHSPTRIASRLALIHCEISEAVECVARGRMELYFIAPGGGKCAPNHPGAKPEGFPIELADVFLRTCDLAESLGVTMPYDFDQYHTYVPRKTPEAITASLNGLHETVAEFHTYGTNTLQDAPIRLRNVLRDLNKIALGTGVDLLAMAELKHEFNKTRPIMHGGKVL